MFGHFPLLAQYESEIVVKLNDYNTTATFDSLQRGFKSAIIQNRDGKRGRIRKEIPLRYKRVFPYAGKHEAKHQKHGLHLWYRLSYDSTVVNDSALIAVLKKSSSHIEKSRYDVQSLPMPGDSLFPQQWNFNNTGQTRGRPGADIDLLNAHRIERGLRNVVISIHDTGVDSLHRDLINHLWTNPDEVPNNGIDDDNNGYIDDVHGWNFALGNNDVHDTEGHGTHVAGIIAASGDEHGIIGIAGGDNEHNGVTIMVCNLDDPFGGLSIRNPEESIIYAADNGAIISQNSWNTFGVSYSVLAAIKYFAEEAESEMMTGGVIVFSAGNFGTSEPRYENQNPNIIMVGNIDHKDALHNYSNHGSWLDLCAPGTNVLSSHVQGTWKLLSGTSMAAPHVTGVAGLIASRFGSPGFTPDSLIKKINLSADPIDEFNWGYYKGKLGTGRVNAFRALVENDLAGPVSVDTLFATKVRSQDIGLKWRAPHDDLFAPFRYQINYAEVVNKNISDSAALHVNIRYPVEGDTITARIEQLKPDTDYAFSLISFDYFGNPSPPSDTLRIRTLHSPEISISDFPTQHHFPIDSLYVTKLNIHNSGESELDWSFSDHHPDSAEFSNLQVKTGNYWTYYEVHQFAEAAGATVTEVSRDLKPSDLTGVKVLILDDQVNGMDSLQSKSVRDWVLHGGSVMLMFNYPGIEARETSIASLFNVRYESYAEYRTTTATVNGQHPTLDGIERIRLSSFVNYLIPDSSGEFPDNEVLVRDDEGNAHVVAKEFGKGKVIVAANRIMQSYGIYDEDNFHLAKNLIRWMAANPRVRFQPASGTLSGGSTQEVQVTFNHNLGNFYSGSFFLKNNDLSDTLKQISFTVRIDGKPLMYVRDSVLIYDTAFVGYSLEKFTLITNGGTDTLHVNAEFTSAVYTSADTALVIPPGKQDSISVNFRPTETGQSDGSLILRGDHDHTIILTGNAIRPPALDIFPTDSLIVYLSDGDKKSKQIYINNLHGGSKLKYSVELLDDNPISHDTVTIQFKDKEIAMNNRDSYITNINNIPWNGSDFHSLKAPLSSNNFTIDTIDCLVLDQVLYNYSNSDIDRIREYVKLGGSLIVHIEQVSNVDKLRRLLSGTTFKSYGFYQSGFTDTLHHFYLNPVAQGMTAMRPNYFTTYINVDNQFHEVLRDNLGNTHIAWDTLGSGRILITSSRMFALAFNNFQNRSYVIQAFNWLINKSPGWLIASGKISDLAAGEMTSISLQFDNSRKQSRAARLKITSNDPDVSIHDVQVEMKTGTPVHGINHSPTVIVDTIAIFENAPEGTVIGNARGYDMDGDVVQWRYTGPSLGVSTDGQLTVHDPSAFNFENQPNLLYHIQAMDWSDTTDAMLLIKVKDINEVPSLVLPDTIVTDEDVAVSARIMYQDPENDTVNLRFTANNKELVEQHPVTLFNDTLFIQPDINEYGSLNMTVYADDGELIDSAVFTISILPTNDPPKIDSMQDITIFEGDSLYIRFSISDPDDDAVNVSIRPHDLSLMDSISFNLVLSSTDFPIDLPAKIKSNGETTVSVTVNDGQDASQRHFTVKIDRVITSLPAEDVELKLFPNPTNQYLKLENNTGSKLVGISFFNSHGQLVERQAFKEDDPEIINVSKLDDGVYIVKVLLESGAVSFKKLSIRK